MQHKKDYLPNTEIYYRQRNDMFKTNTDTALLGEFMKINSDDKVLDIGCNNGALMLYVSRYDYKEVVGIDIFKEAIDLANENLIDNNVNNYRLICDDVTVHKFNEQFDVILCNPPFFNTSSNGNINENEFLHVARHEGSLNIHSLMETVSKLLKEKGRFYLVHRSLRLSDIITESNNFNLRARSMQLVYDEDKEHSTSVLVEFVKDYHGDVKIMHPKWLKR